MLALMWAVGLLLCGCSTVDLRPTELLQPSEHGVREVRGRALLEGALEASGGRARWERIESAELHLADLWRGWVGYLFRPWPGNPTELQVQYKLGMRAARVTFLTGSVQGERWGRDAAGTWSQAPGEQRHYCRREAVRFILGAYQYFFELPLRLSEAPTVLYAGQRVRDGKEYALVFVTWGSAEPHLEHDQYLVWISKQSGLLEIAQYTIRDKFRFATGVNYFSDFREVDGLLLPHAYWIARELEDRNFVHRVQLEEIQLLPKQHN